MPSDATCARAFSAKPRIRIRANGLCECRGFGIVAVGDSPEHAYRAWIRRQQQLHGAVRAVPPPPSIDWWRVLGVVLCLASAVSVVVALVMAARWWS